MDNWAPTGWEPAALDDFHPQNDTQIMCDNYSIGIEGNEIVIDYYRTKYDMENDDESEIKIKRALSRDEQAFWKTQVDHIKTIHSSPKSVGKIP
jgi:hypothetical protein